MLVDVTIERRLEFLQPSFRALIELLIADLALKRVGLAPFETYRHPGRQKALSRDVTKALPWQSAHQYGLACDFAKPDGRGFTWKVPRFEWVVLHESAEALGLRVPAPSWDPGHVEDPRFLKIRTLLPVHE